METRKHNRLKEYDYSQNGYYFITICTAEKRKILGDISVGANCVRPYGVRPKTVLSEIGKIVDENICRLNGIYDTVRVDKYVVMPNHVHLILVIQDGQIQDGRTQFAPTESTESQGAQDGQIQDGRTQFAPTVSRVIKQFKGKVTKQVGFCIWQKSFYDHIIRDEKEYLRIWEYIENNPDKWAEDKYYI